MSDVEKLENRIARLEGLAKSYRLDVESRISILEGEREALVGECYPGSEDEESEVCFDIDEQLRHWRATLAEILHVLEDGNDLTEGSVSNA